MKKFERKGATPSKMIVVMLRMLNVETYHITAIAIGVMLKRI